MLFAISNEVVPSGNSFTLLSGKVILIIRYLLLVTC
jgi:hypothetical protein